MMKPGSEGADEAEFGWFELASTVPLGRCIKAA